MSDFWEKHLEVGEKLLWEGRPEKGAKVAIPHPLSDAKFIMAITLFTLMPAFLLFMLDAETLAHTRRGIPLGYVLWFSLAFFAPLSIWRICCPAHHRFYVFRLYRLRYAQTNRRAIRANAKGKILLHWDLECQHLPWMEPDAVFFGLRKWRKNRQHFTGISGRKFSDLSGFEMIPDAESVYARAIKAIKNLDA